MNTKLTFSSVDELIAYLEEHPALLKDAMNGLVMEATHYCISQINKGNHSTISDQSISEIAEKMLDRRVMSGNDDTNDWYMLLQSHDAIFKSSESIHILSEYLMCCWEKKWCQHEALINQEYYDAIKTNLPLSSEDRVGFLLFAQRDKKIAPHMPYMLQDDLHGDAKEVINNTQQLLVSDMLHILGESTNDSPYIESTCSAAKHFLHESFGKYNDASRERLAFLGKYRKKHRLHSWSARVSANDDHAPTAVAVAVMGGV